MESSNSRFGVRGHEKLGGGLKAVFQLETEFHVDTNDSRFAQRDSFIGLAHDRWGTVKLGRFDQSEKARLAESIEAALAWTSKQAAQDVVDAEMAVEATGDVLPGEAFRYESSPKPKLRVIKLASKREALPGDIIDFTIRFDNIGNEVVGNVTVIDNLTTRLEYVPDSAQCSLPAEFKPVVNEGDSLILRWEITDPLARAHGGIIRFKCRVR